MGSQVPKVNLVLPVISFTNFINSLQLKDIRGYPYQGYPPVGGCKID